MDQRISVLHLLSNLSLRSGVASVVVNYCRMLDKAKIKFTILYFDEVQTETYKEELKQLGCEAYYIPRNELMQKWKIFCKEHYGKYDILHNHQSFLAPMLTNVKKQLGTKKLITHAHATKFSDTRLKGVRNRILSYPSKFISDSLIACSHDAGKALFGRTFLKKGKVIHNAINTEVFAYSQKTRNEVREQLKINDSFIIGHVGNMTPPKNHSFILEVFRQVLLVKPNAKLLLVGDGYLRSKIEGKVKQFGLEEQVILLGVQSDVYRYYNAMDIFLFPSLFEGLGIVLVEAQTNGLKCVYSDKVPFEADCNANENVRLSLNAPIREWVQNICNIQGRTDNKHKIRQNGYDISYAVDDLVEFYFSLLSGGNNEKRCRNSD